MALTSLCWAGRISFPFGVTALLGRGGPGQGGLWCLQNDKHNVPSALGVCTSPATTFLPT